MPFFLFGCIISINFKGAFDMEFLVFLSYFLFAFLLFLFLNYMMKKFSLTKVEYILFTNIFLVFLAAIASYFHFLTFCDDIFIIVVFEFLIRMLYASYLLDKDFFAKEDGVLPLYLGNVVVAYLLNQFIICQVEMVFLNPEQLKFLLWVFIILFFYHFFHQKEKLSFIKDRDRKSLDLGDRKQYIIHQYTKMKQKYGSDIRVKGDMRLLIYALMIFENYKRPTFFRQIDYFRYQFDHVPKKQGIMQVDTKRILSDVESIEFVEKKLENLQSKKQTKKNTIDVLALLKSLGKKKEECLEIEKVYHVLKEFIEL